MLIGVIADDFTGASDIANTLAKGVSPVGGLRTAQYPGIPKGPSAPDIEAGVVSLKSRTAPVEEAVRESLAALDWLLGQGCRQIVFKYCSTFDSTKEGNIGPVSEALANALDADKVVFCPAFPSTGRTIFQGHLFVHDKPLNESGLQNHPLTPMIDADIRRWLGYQTRETVGHVPLSDVWKGPEHVAQVLRNKAERFLVADAVTDGDLLVLGEALRDAKLMTGGSGIALGLGRNVITRRTDNRPTAPQHISTGPGAILAGSCSGATRQQIDVHKAHNPAMAIDVPAVMAGDVTSAVLTDFLRGHVGKAPLVYSSDNPDEVRSLQSRFGREAVAERLDALFAETAEELIKSGFKRLVVAGGETSGAVAQAVARALRCEAMTVGPEIDPGVPVLRLGKEGDVALALKSGNFGAADFFAKALQVMEAGY